MSKKSDTENMQAEEKLGLFGSYRFKVDAKGRVALPAKLRKALSSDLVVTPDLKATCAYVFEHKGFEDWVESLFDSKFDGYSPSDPLQVGLRRELNANASNVEVDSSGRIPLNEALRNKLGIQREVVLVGNSDHMEIWDASAYDAATAQIDLGVFFE